MDAQEGPALLRGAGVELDPEAVDGAGRAQGRLAGGPVPRGVGAHRGQPPCGAGPDLPGRRPVHERLPAFGDPRPGVAPGGVVADPHLGPREPVGAAVRRHAAGRARPGRWNSWRSEPPGAAARPPGEWYRYHHLFRDLLASELARREPDIVPESTGGRRRGTRPTECPRSPSGTPRPRSTPTRWPGWCSGSEAGVDRGRADTVLCWMTWFDDQGLVRATRESPSTAL